ncbi:hypothetical protein [Robinsoniella peoriensis]|uniref:hypothetical protein n=1 Tax=Robinsoniella peoriensis TaxID=180332 RepID=UPI00085C27F6|nr:hypothetical protein [Robinsoniella peoriensis]
MNFDKNKFVKDNSQFLYNKLCDFLECEINSYKDIIHLLLCENIKSFIYEGNQYLLEKNEKSSKILIVDEIARENGVNDSQCVFIIEKNDLIELMYNKKDK